MSKWSHRLLLAALFGLADGIGFLIGAMAGVASPLRMSGAEGEPLEILLPAILGVYLVGIAIIALMGLLIGAAVMSTLPALQRRAAAAATSGAGLIVFSIILITLESME